MIKQRKFFKLLVVISILTTSNAYGLTILNSSSGIIDLTMSLTQEVQAQRKKQRAFEMGLDVNQLGMRFASIGARLHTSETTSTKILPQQLCLTVTIPGYVPISVPAEWLASLAASDVLGLNVVTEDLIEEEDIDNGGDAMDVDATSTTLLVIQVQGKATTFTLELTPNAVVCFSAKVVQAATPVTDTFHNVTVHRVESDTVTRHAAQAETSHNQD